MEERAERQKKALTAVTAALAAARGCAFSPPTPLTPMTLPLARHAGREAGRNSRPCVMKASPRTPTHGHRHSLAKDPIILPKIGSASEGTTPPLRLADPDALAGTSPADSPTSQRHRATPSMACDAAPPRPGSQTLCLTTSLQALVLCFRSARVPRWAPLRLPLEVPFPPRY